MKGQGFDLQNLSLDEEGRIVLTDQDLAALAEQFVSDFAGGANTGCGGGGYNNPCTNSNCDGSRNGRCRNTGGCDDASNYNCDNSVIQ